MSTGFILAQDLGPVLPAPDAAGSILALMIIFWAFAIAATVFWLWALLDALTNEPTTNDKILWFLVIFFLNIVGAVAYLILRCGKRERTLA